MIKLRLKRKIRNKTNLQEQLGLRVAPDVCLIGMVGRLTWQKGINLVIEKDVRYYGS